MADAFPFGRAPTDPQGLATELARVQAQARAALEEAQAANEELQAANEELAAQREELRSVNARLQAKTTELEATSNDLNSLLSSIDLAVLVLDPRHHIRHYTRATKDLLDLVPGDLGRSVTALRWKFTDPHLLADARAVFDRLVPVAREVEADGGRQYLRRVLPYRTRDDRIDGVAVTFLDVTAQKTLEEQFRQAQKMEAVGQLAAGVAHDFNNLLTVINGYSKLYLSSPAPDPEWRESIAEIYSAGRRATELTAQLLAFSRQTVLEPRVLSPNGLIRGTVKLLSRLLGEDVELLMSLTDDAGRVCADRTQLEQALVNLSVNARDAMPRGGRLTLATRNEQVGAGRGDAPGGAYVVIRVSDTGHGMDAATRGRVFEPFFTTKGVGKGTGLGLAMVYGFVKQSGGFLEVHSEPGRGAAFDIFLPRVYEEVATEAEPEPAPLVRGGGTVLLVEDDGWLRKFTSAILQSAGYTVLEATDGADAAHVARSRAAAIDLILTDVVLPGGLSGREVVETVRASHPGARVLYTSGYTDDAVMRYGVATKSFEFLPKPFASATLIAKVQEVLDRR
ncbi:PAS domain-containing protein [Gemmata sp. JC673]|uniref:histidine kinase n=1 Tax=Gemmata algarum TaxID=2975278 RepID=A0ABU5EZT6_9BACT|nr:ATP-binding protein [Gemmata algarum]MDY3560012.1 PAS domain-containing protein [Gemmata algarum]